MFCSKCENEVNEGAVFCPKNGEKLINENYQQKKDSTETEAITSFILWLVSVAFWVTIIIPISGIYFGNKGKNSATVRVDIALAYNIDSISNKPVYFDDIEYESCFKTIK